MDNLDTWDNPREWQRLVKGIKPAGITMISVRMDVELWQHLANAFPDGDPLIGIDSTDLEDVMLVLDDEQHSGHLAVHVDRGNGEEFDIVRPIADFLAAGPASNWPIRT